MRQTASPMDVDSKRARRGQGVAMVVRDGCPELRRHWFIGKTRVYCLKLCSRLYLAGFF